MNNLEHEYNKIITEKRRFYVNTYSSSHTDMNSNNFCSRRLHLNFLDSLIPYKSIVDSSRTGLKRETMLYGYLSTICNFYEYILQEINFLFDFELLDVKSQAIIEKKELSEKSLLERIIDKEYRAYPKDDFVFKNKVISKLRNLNENNENIFIKLKVNELIDFLTHECFEILKVLRNNHFHSQNLFSSDYRIYNPNKKIKDTTLKPLGEEKRNGEEKAIRFLGLIYYKYIEIMKCLCDIEYSNYMQIDSEFYLCLSFECDGCNETSILPLLVTKKLLDSNDYHKLTCLNCYHINFYDPPSFPQLVKVYFKNDFNNLFKLSDQSKKNYHLYK